jgi:hypothetical protein
METFHSLEWCDSKIGKISDVESHFPMFGVGVTLLTRLRGFQTVADELNLFFRFSEYVRSKHLTFSCLRPVERGSALPPIEGFERCHLKTGLIAIIIGELCEG